jgi:hypothetical protein
MTRPLEAAWNAVHDATPSGKQVGQPAYAEYRNQWTMSRSTPTPALGPGSLGRGSGRRRGLGDKVLQEMARCLEVIGRGEWPK